MSLRRPVALGRFGAWDHSGAKANSIGCSSLTIAAPDYSDVDHDGYYDLQFPLILNDVSVFGWGAPQPWAAINPNTGVVRTGSATIGYGLEHVYEVQDVVQRAVTPGLQAIGYTSFCTWLKTFIFTNQFPNNDPPVSQQLANTLPNTGNALKELHKMPLLNMIANQAK
ncbi:hypothetical protein EIP86_009015 [Pleurotus ostreatoroseus]|nr:hypothetical protein EIP86_009015 [Pleurotus ostreatoroseus]